MRTDILERKNEIVTMIQNNESKALICRMLKCRPETFEGYLKKMNIQYKGNVGLKGKKDGYNRKSAIEYSHKTIPHIPKLRKKLIEDGLKEDKCELCNTSEWMGKRLTLELHHKDGNRFNNELENLQILCPNCHSLTPNHSHQRKKIKNKITKKEIKIKFCQCGKPIKRRSTYCLDCYKIEQRSHKRPEISILISDIKLLGYRGTGKKYGVSDNAIRKWIKNAGVMELVVSADLGSAAK